MERKKFKNSRVSNLQLMRSQTTGWPDYLWSYKWEFFVKLLAYLLEISIEPRVTKWFVPNGLCFAFCSSRLCIHKVWIKSVSFVSQNQTFSVHYRNNFWRKLCCHIGWRWHNHSPIMPAWLSSFHWYPHWRIWRTLFLQLLRRNRYNASIYSPVCILLFIFTVSFH